MADLESSSAEALMSLKSSGKKKPSLLNTPPRRGHPTRKRKRNRLYFEDDEKTPSTPPSSSSNKTRKTSKPRNNAMQPMSTPDKKTAQKIGAQLKNLLKLPKAYKWCIYEWFYSNIDKALFGGENDFCIWLKETFPQLKTKSLTRVEWSMIRRLMGKPRRCSPAFFAEERRRLGDRRQKVRLLQQKKGGDSSQLKDLPEEIPFPLVIGTKVTARLRQPQDGLFTGQIEAVNTMTASYRVTFDRPNLNTHTVPDTEVLSSEPHETMPLASFLQRQRPRTNFFTPPRLTIENQLQSPQQDHDPMLTASPLRSRLQGTEGGTLGGFPVQFLVLVTRLTKILSIKKDKIQMLRDMNTEAERLRSYLEPIPLDFQQKYASLVLELERLNKDLNTYLEGVHQYCQEIAPEQGLQSLNHPSEQRKQCEAEAREMLAGVGKVKSQSLNDLVASLTSLLLMIQSLAQNDIHSFELKSLTEAVEDIKKKIDPSNRVSFQDCVEIHVAHIQSGMSQMGNLHAFSSSLNM